MAFQTSSNTKSHNTNKHTQYCVFRNIRLVSLFAGEVFQGNLLIIRGWLPVCVSEAANRNLMDGSRSSCLQVWAEMTNPGTKEGVSGYVEQGMSKCQGRSVLCKEMWREIKVFKEFEERCAGKRHKLCCIRMRDLHRRSDVWFSIITEKFIYKDGGDSIRVETILLAWPTHPNRLKFDCLYLVHHSFDVFSGTSNLVEQE